MTDRSADIEAVAVEQFANAVWDALKGDHNDLRKQVIILQAYRAAIEALRPFHAAAEAKARLDAYEDAAGVARELWSNNSPIKCTPSAIAAAILQRGGETK